MSVSSNLLSDNVYSIETDTSGWTAGANTTLSKSTRFFYGAASLGMTATAAGSVVVTTAVRVPVVVGQEYMAYACFANVAAASGRVATVRVDWWAASSGGTALSSATSATSALPNATTWTTPPPALLANAPSGAAYASVTLTVTGMTAGAIVVADAIALGPSALIAGNLLPYNTQGVEVSSTGWASQTNVTVARSSTLPYEGWYSLTMTSVAAGATETRQVTAVAVTAGVEYVAHCWMQAAVAGLEFKIQILWYDAGGTGIGTRFSQSWTPAAATWTRCSVIGVAPPGAVTARIALSPVATAAGQLWTADQITLRPTPIPAGSLIGYNTASMEVDDSGWMAVNGCAVSRSTDTSYEGAASLRIDPTGTGDATWAQVGTVPVTARQSYSVTAPMKLGASALDRTARTSLVWYDSGGSVIAQTTLTWRLNPSAGGWYSLTTSAAAPDRAVSMVYQMTLVAPPAGTPVYLDAITITPGGTAVIADPIVSRYGASIALQGLTAGGYDRWSLWRTDPTGESTYVRGPIGDLLAQVITGDVAVVEDYEAPLGVPVVYTIQLRSSVTGTARSSLSSPLVIPEAPPTDVVIKDPGLPARQTTAVVARGGQPAWTRRARQGVNAVRGRARPIVISDARASREGTMTLVTGTEEELTALWWLLDPGSVLLLQWPTDWGMTDMYVSVGDVDEAPATDYAPHLDRTWTLPLTEVDRPIGGAAGTGGRTWLTVSTESATWGDVLAAHRTWLDVYTGMSGG